jgi:hypothetical protein
VTRTVKLRNLGQEAEDEVKLARFEPPGAHVGTDEKGGGLERIAILGLEVPGLEVRDGMKKTAMVSGRGFKSHLGSLVGTRC